MIFYLFRHGQTYFSKHHLRYGKQIETAEILPEGIPQIKAIAKRLMVNNVKQIYSSPIKRCVQTVNIIQKENPLVKITFDQRLEEEKISRGLETFKNQTKRIEEILNEIKSKNYEKVGICSHGWPIAVMMRLLRGEKVHRYNLISFPKCGELVIIETK